MYTHHILFIHSPMYGQLGFFQYFAFINYVAVDNIVQMYFHIVEGMSLG